MLHSYGAVPIACEQGPVCQGREMRAVSKTARVSEEQFLRLRRLPINTRIRARQVGPKAP